MDEIFQALADPTRRKILQMLKRSDLPAGRIAEAFEVSRPAISHHLAVLKRAGLAQQRRQGQQLIYSLRHDGILSACHAFLSRLCVGSKKGG